ncbi:uncharacterized protein XM38_007280 [Halomicronema hongdechloris C2206]|uniref:histidine kinase n=1 Tax=Halomicronema hongdechloris C2206 TaxID=1641165 RepID=A0A1Z3HHK4_9CYAN|nr:sensor histidine kinase [Halomicronema hongdechloris]ASC69799.1 uncharacterized protein XM38_007280 [Halomicronema hongdechloris C2206]
MRDLGQSLAEKIDQVVENWINSVHQDTEIESTRKLTHQAIRNSLPEVLQELANLLSHHQLHDGERLERRSLYHGSMRAQQGYDTAEIVREYRLLRQTVLLALDPDLLTGSPAEILSAIRTIDDVLDEIISASLESYIESRLTELRQIQGQLTLTNQELIRLVKAQKESLSFMAHELKNPLNSIIGHSSLLLRQQRKKLKGKDVTTNLDGLERVLRNGRRLLQIINDTLEISRYNEGQVQLNLEPVNVGELIQEIIEDALEPLAVEKNLNLAVDMADAPKEVLTDSLRLQQIVTNLVANAIHYTDEGRVRIACRSLESDGWQITVADTGIGISAADRARIFDPYVQAKPSPQAEGSAGLGLAIVQRIVTLMNGTIEVTSEVGQGSVFTVTLPLLQPE